MLTARRNLAATHLNGDSVSILLGDGFGSFTPTAHYAVSSYPYRAAVGDLNGDGVPDLAVGNGTADTVSIFDQRIMRLPDSGPLLCRRRREILKMNAGSATREVSVNDWSNAFDGRRLRQRRPVLSPAPKPAGPANASVPAILRR
jgi:hypothetical protein